MGIVNCSKVGELHSRKEVEDLQLEGTLGNKGLPLSGSFIKCHCCGILVSCYSLSTRSHVESDVLQRGGYCLLHGLDRIHDIEGREVMPQYSTNHDNYYK